MSTPLYVSPPSAKSLRNEYRVYDDRIELDIRLPLLPARTWRFPFEDITAIEVASPPAFRRGFWGLKLDLADLNPHVCLKTKSGFWKTYYFTPDDPTAFVAAVAARRNANSGSSAQ